MYSVNKEKPNTNKHDPHLQLICCGSRDSSFVSLVQLATGFLLSIESLLYLLFTKEMRAQVLPERTPITFHVHMVIPSAPIPSLLVSATLPFSIFLRPSVQF